MQLTMEDTGRANRIRGYDVNSITVNETVYHRTTVVARDQLLTDWAPDAVEQLSTAYLDQLLEMDPELVIIGTGGIQQFPHRDVLRHAIQAGVGIEVMTTPAACRTYNVLMAEDRRAVVALFMIREEE